MSDEPFWQEWSHDLPQLEGDVAEMDKVMDVVRSYIAAAIAISIPSGKVSSCVLAVKGRSLAAGTFPTVDCQVICATNHHVAVKVKVRNGCEMFALGSYHLKV